MPLGGGGGAEVGGGLIGAIGTGAALATAPAGGEKFLKAAIELWKKLETSNFDFRSLSPPERRILAQYSPEVYDAVVPTEVKQADDSQEGRQAQLGGIQYFENIRDQGQPLSTRIATRQAQNAIQQQQQAGLNQTLEGYAARGRLGGGAELAARLGGNQQAMDLAARLGDDLAMREIEARMNAASQAAGLGGQERAQTIGRNQWNADSVNRFNEYVARLKTQAAADNAAARERAQFGNVGNIQRIGEENELDRYQTMLDNLNRQNALRGSLFNQQVTRIGGLTDAYGNLANARDLKRAEYIGNISGASRAGGSALGGAYGLI